MTEVCYFACYGYAGSPLSLTPHPSQGATFAHTDPGQHGPRVVPIAALGTLGFGEPGEHPCLAPELDNCCLPDGSCTQLPSFECQELGGVVLGLGPCEPDPCPRPIGACCVANGDCGEMLRYHTDVFQGDYRGDGAICEPVHCAVAPTEHASWGAIKVRYR